MRRALRSYERQVALHQQKMQSPVQCIQEWDQKSPRVQQALLRHWQEDGARNQELAEIMRGILQERHRQACKTRRNLSTICST